MAYHLQYCPGRAEPIRLAVRSEGEVFGEETDVIGFPDPAKLREVGEAMVGYANSLDRALSRHGSLPGQSHTVPTKENP